jgi:dipeptide transport system substrate-binding protein
LITGIVSLPRRHGLAPLVVRGSSPQMKNKIVAVAAAAALATLLGAGQAGAKTLVYCSEGSPENFNPMINTTGTTFDANLPIYNRLTEFKLGSTEVVPGLAESWEISPDAKTFVFHLRKGVKWQSNKNFTPTRDFNADDVIFSFDRQWKDSNPYHKVSGGGYDYFGDMGMNDLLDKIEKVDDYTIRFVLKEPNTPFLANLAMDFASIQSKEYADKLLAMGKPELIDQDPIGTGPFSLVNYQKDTTIRYKKFDGYWGPAPKVESLVFSITKDPAVRLAKLRAGECQIMPYPNPADLPSIKSDANLQLLSQPGLNIGYLAMNVTKKPFDDVRVRRAINMAIDKKSILDAVYQGAGQPAKNLIPPTMWGYNDAVQDFQYDPAEAKNLLAAAGYPDGFETDIWAMPVQRPYNPDAKRIAELMQADLAKIGIKAKIVSYEWGEYRKRIQQGDHQMAEFGWTGDNGDPDNFFVPLAGCAAARPGGGNVAKWCNKEFDDLVNKAATVADQAERAKLYEQAQVVMHREAPFYLIAHSVVFQPLAKNVVGYKMSPLGRHQFDDVDLK